MRPQILIFALLVPSLPAAAQLRPADDPPAVRAARGDLGMFFRFGGLATMGTDSPGQDAAGLVFNQVGLKFVLSHRWMLPVYFGVGLGVNAPSGPSESQVDWGLMFGAGFEYHFRIWRRISPYLGASLGFELNDPRGDRNFRFATSVGPQLGIEFYWADRTSLAAYYEFRLRVVTLEDAYTQASFQTAAGGGLILTFYF